MTEYSDPGSAFAGFRIALRRLLPAWLRYRIYLLKMYTRELGSAQGIVVFLKVRLGSGPTVRVSVPGAKTPVLVRPRTSDVGAFEQVFLRGDYRFSTKLSFKFIVDCGANVGYATIYFANRFRSARILAIEPERGNFELLVKNTACYGNVERKRAALWPRKTQIDLTNPASASDHWSFRAQEGIPSAESVDTITMLDLLDLSPHGEIDMLKLDIEGAERDIFASPLLEWLSKVKVLIVELHDWIWPDCSAKFNQAISGRGFRSYTIGENVLLVRDDVARV